MNSDKVAFWGMVIGLASLMFGVVSAIAAVFAAVYAKGSATQRSLAVVEQNTANTTEQITAVKSHIAQVEEHLRIQNNRESLDIAARATSISVAGEGWNDEPQNFVFTVRTPGMIMNRVDLVNGVDLLSGTVACNEVRPGVFAATINPQTFGKWLNSGDPLPPGDRRVIYVKAGLTIEGALRFRTFAVVTALQMRQRPDCMTYYYTTTGQC
jgi:hypothetical protein